MGKTSPLLLALLTVLGCHARPRAKAAVFDQTAAGDLAWLGPRPPSGPRRPPPPPDDEMETPPAAALAANAPEATLSPRNQTPRRRREGAEAGLRTELSTEPVKPELEHPPATALNDRIGLASERRAEESLPRPDETSLGRPTPPRRYLSPAAVKRPPVSRDRAEQDPFAAQTPHIPQDPANSSTATAIDAPPLSSLKAAIPEIAFVEPTMAGSYRLQVATSADCANPLIDRSYSFVDEIDLHHDLAVRRAPDGVYWVRVAFIDLLDYQQPFGAARPYKFRR